MEWAVALGLVAYNNALNFWPPFNGSLYLPFNLTLAAILGWLSIEVAGLTTWPIGGERWPLWALAGLGAALLLTVPLFALGRTRWRDKVADRRVTHLSGAALAYQTLLRIPIGTALLEEVAFRGVLFGSWIDDVGLVPAGALSSVAFGLWHVAPSINMVRANTADPATRDVLLTVVGSVGFTTLVGAFFCFLAWWSGGLALPIALHAGVNSFATLAAVSAGRSERARDGRRGLV